MKIMLTFLVLMAWSASALTAPVPVAIVHISTDAGLMTGRTCNLVRHKIDVHIPPAGDSFTILNCATWTTTAPQSHIIGTPMASVNVQNVGIFYDCDFLDQDLATTLSNVEFDCRGAFQPFEMFGDGFER